MLIKFYYILVVFFSTAQHTALANLPHYGSFADQPVDSLACSNAVLVCLGLMQTQINSLNGIICTL